MAPIMNDPLANPKFRSPGFGEKLKEFFLGSGRPLECVQIEVTSYCSAACTYCPHTTHAENWRSRHISAETFASLWPLLTRSGRAHLQGWGEPLLHPRFFDFVAFAAKAGCQVSTTSCGLKMNEEMAHKILGSGMDVIAFSLVGTDEKSNNARVNAPFEKVCANIRLLRKAINSSGGSGPELHLAYLLLADRMEAARRLPELMGELDVEMAVVSTLDYLALPGQRNFAIGPEDTEKIEKAKLVLGAAAEEAGKDGRIIYYSLPDPDIAVKEGCRENISRSVYADADGMLSPCIYQNVPFNNGGQRRGYGCSLEKDAWQIWNEPDFANFRRNLVGGNPAEECEACPKRHERIYIEM